MEALIAALNDGDIGVRIEAERRLCTIKDPRAVEPLLARFNDKDSAVVCAVVRAVGEMGYHCAVEPFMKVLALTNQAFLCSEPTGSANTTAQTNLCSKKL